MKTQKEIFAAFPKLDAKTKVSIARALEHDGKIERKTNPRAHNRIEFSEEQANHLFNALKVVQDNASSGSGEGSEGAPNASGHRPDTSGQGNLPALRRGPDGKPLDNGVQPGRPDTSGQGKRSDRGAEADANVVDDGVQPRRPDTSGHVRTGERPDTSRQGEYAIGFRDLLRKKGIFAPGEQHTSSDTSAADPGKGMVGKLEKWQTIALIVGLVVIIGVAVYLVAKHRKGKTAPASPDQRPPTSTEIKSQIMQRQAARQAASQEDVIDLDQGPEGVTARVEDLIAGIR